MVHVLRQECHSNNILFQLHPKTLVHQLTTFIRLIPLFPAYFDQFYGTL